MPAMPLAPGTPAPDFTLRSTTPETADIRLSDNFGKRNTVLLFFPGAFTGPCTQELCGVAKGQFLKADEITAVYGISVDSPVAQKAWAEKEGITTPLLSDYGRQTIHAYDVVLPNFFGTQGEASARAVFVIDREGVIRHSQQTAAPGDMPDFDAVDAALAAL